MRWLARAAALCAALAASPAGAQPADRVFVGGKVVTLDDAKPSAEALAVRAGRIVAVGTLAEIEAWKGDATQVSELSGAALLPGFIDAHGHVSGAGFFASVANLLPAPDGSANDMNALAAALRAWGATDAAREAGWIVGMGYDESQLAEKRHPTRKDLDRVSADVPVIAIHISGHLAVVNTRALGRLGISKATLDPAGGAIQRDTTGEPTGLLEENAFFSVYPKLPSFDPVAQLEKGQALYAANGFTTAQEGRATPPVMKGLLSAAAAGKLSLDVLAYPDMLANPADVMSSKYRGAQYLDHLRIAGWKLSLDGSPSAKTAWLTQPYFVPPPGQPRDYRGYPQIEQAVLDAKIDEAFAAGVQVIVHCNGDAAIDSLLEAVRKATQKYGPGDRRTVAIHAQTARADQLDAMVELGVIPSFFTLHTFYFGDYHRDSSLGPERAANISPEGWALAKGLRFTSHHDAPVVPPNALRVLWAQVTRKTRSGKVLGPEQRVTPEVALKAITAWAAYQSYEEANKGTLEPGKLADLVVLDKSPLAVAPDALDDLKVLETIKAGQTIYRAPE
jgi:predicted amidohydrolase YtcJ